MHSTIKRILNETTKRVSTIKNSDNNIHEKKIQNKRDVISAIREKQMKGYVPVISEVKPSSPSQRYMTITPQKAATIAIQMESAGAVAVSVLTEPVFFHGSLENLESVRKSVNIPVLRKDFIIDERQLSESKCDIILLITCVLGNKLAHFVDIALSKGIEPLVEAQNKEELYIALETNARLIGINNRNFDTMKVDLNTTRLLAPLVRKYDAENGTDHVIVCESGIDSCEDVKAMIDAGADALLIGTSIIKSDNIYYKTKELVEAAKCTKNFADQKRKELLQEYVGESEHT
jgi:indole-3-glycerol phosphate synthase